MADRFKNYSLLIQFVLFLVVRVQEGVTGSVQQPEQTKKVALQYSNLDLTNVCTPVKVEVYENLLIQSGYRREFPDLFCELVLGFRYGIDLGYRGPQKVKLTAANLKLRVGNETELWNKVMKEVKLKRFAGPFSEFPFEYYIQSPIGLVPKDEDDTRLIFYLSYPRNGAKQSVNSNIDPADCKVQYPDFADVIRLCLIEGKLCNLSRSNFCAAFRNLGISRKFWKFLCMRARNPDDGKLYIFVDKCLSFGGSISCRLFQDFSNSIAYIVK